MHLRRTTTTLACLFAFMSMAAASAAPAYSALASTAPSALNTHFYLPLMTMPRAPGTTANNLVPLYTGQFQYGLNGGYYGNGWDDTKIYTLGSDIGSKTTRASLPDAFIAQWGVNIRTTEFAYFYDTLQFRENTLFLGQPRKEWQDPSVYFKDSQGQPVQSKLWQGMYQPIWDNGQNGTPVNDNNRFALYMWSIVNSYGRYIRFYEIINEPDYTNTAAAYAQPGDPKGSWWDSAPAPKDLPNLNAPIYNYIRLLRIAYEVVKQAYPDSYITPGGVGYNSFVDALTRYTDNPDGGKVTPAYPLTGGAYFDALSYHIYPQFGGRYWDNTQGGFVYARHSDRMIDVFAKQKQDMQAALSKRGYNGTTYPNKYLIITETNIPRKRFGDYIGSPEAQRNYLLKALVKSQQLDIKQVYWFLTGDTADEATATSEFDLMGFYQNLKRDKPGSQKLTPEGIAHRTATQQLFGWRYDDAATKALNLPSGVDGAAFRKGSSLRYVLWARTSVDLSETASATVSLPGSFEAVAWDGSKQTIGGANIQLAATPVFLTPK